MTPDAICFDLDDTLYDYEQYARSGLAAAADRLEAMTERRLHDELVDLYFGADVTEGTFDRLVERHELSPDLIDDLVDAFHGATDPLRPYPGAGRVLDRLGEEHALALITDGRGGHAKLDRLGLRDVFDAVLVTHSVGRSKREPVVFERVLVALSARPGASVHVGDDPRADFRAANELGMTTVRLRRGRYVDLDPADGAAAPDHEIDGLDELPGVIEGIQDRELTGTQA